MTYDMREAMSNELRKSRKDIQEGERKRIWLYHTYELTHRVITLKTSDTCPTGGLESRSREQISPECTGSAKGNER